MTHLSVLCTCLQCGAVQRIYSARQASTVEHWQLGSCLLLGVLD